MEWTTGRGLQVRMALALGLTLLGYAALLGIVFATFSETGALFVCGLLGTFLVLSVTQADRIAYLATKAVAIERDKYPALYDIVERLASQANLPTPPVAVIPSEKPNALSAGTGDRTVVCLTTGLINELDDDELEAVLAHELAHLKNNDSSVMTVAGFPTIVSGLLFSAVRRTLTPTWFLLGGPLISISLVMMVLPIYVASLPGTLVLSRYREYAADRGAVAITGDPGSLARALATLHDQPSTPNDDLRQVANLNAFCIVPAGVVFPILRTHPPVETRIRKLRELVEEMQ